MSGECQRQRSGGGSIRGNNEELAKSASVTLDRLNATMRQMSDWHEERLVLESNIGRLKSALAKTGKNPDEILRPDPIVVYQRTEIGRLESATERLEDEIRGLREALRESDQAITCSGAKRLKEKMTRLRAEGAEERRKLNDEIRYLKLRVQDAEENSSCSSLCRLRIKLREILNGDKKIERVIADVVSRSCGILAGLSNELTIMKELLDELRLENIRLNSEIGSGAIEPAPNNGMPYDCPDCSGHRETIERLRLHVAELENALNEKEKKLEERDAVVVSLRNEILGAKTAYKLKSQELDGIRCYKSDLDTLRKTLEERDELANDLRRRLTLSNSVAKDAEGLRIEMNRIKGEMLNLEIERDGLLGEIEKMGNIVSDRNERIVSILEGSEEMEKARRSETEGARTKLLVTEAENKRLRLKCENLEGELFKLNETNKAHGDRSAPFVKKVKQLEEEVAEIERISCPTKSRDSIDLNSVVKIFHFTMETRADMNLSDFPNIQRPLTRFTRRLNEQSEIGNSKLKSDELCAKDTRPVNESLQRKLSTVGEEKKVLNVRSDSNDQDAQTTDEFQYKLFKLEADNAEAELVLRETTFERDELKHELKKLVSANRKLNEELEESKRRIDEFLMRNEKLNEKVREYQASYEKLETVHRAELRQALEELDSLKPMKATIDSLGMENRELKARLIKEKETGEELRKSMERLQAESEERSRTGDSETKEKTRTRMNMETKTQTEAEVKTSVMNGGDYVRADRELKYYIHLQSLAVKRIVDFIRYVVGTTNSQPAMATYVEPTRINSMVLNLDETLNATLRMSQALSEQIFVAELTVQELEALKNERNNLKAERDCLTNGMRKLSEMLSVGAARCSLVYFSAMV